MEGAARQCRLNGIPSPVYPGFYLDGATAFAWAAPLVGNGGHTRLLTLVAMLYT
jgi:hypothetical protein